MKTIKTLLVIILTANVFSSFSQITVATDGRVAIGSTSTVPLNFTNLFTGVKTQIAYGSSILNFDLGPANPRITNNTSSIVFYNSTNTDFISIQVKTCYQNSDINAKTNINTVTNGLSIIKKLRGVTFNWKENGSQLKSALNKPSKLEYGLIAQEIEKVLPALILTDDSIKGKMLNYSGVIPILIEAIKDLSEQVDAQKKQLDALTNKGSGLKSATVQTGIYPDNNATPVLEQNKPNPFSQNTQIGYYLPETVQSATLYIYDMNGLQIKSYSLQQKGKGDVTIYGTELRPGMYIYALVADGNEIDTKRMILTQ